MPLETLVKPESREFPIQTSIYCPKKNGSLKDSQLEFKKFECVDFIDFSNDEKDVQSNLSHQAMKTWMALQR